MNRAFGNSIFCLVLLAALFRPTRASETGGFTAGDTLIGLLTSDVKPGAGPFIVAGDLYVPPGTTVKIAKGTVFLFENFVGLHVQGTLLSQGTPSDPIIFTSKNDRAWNPAAPVEAAPFDWNGIDIEESAIGTELLECVIRYSVYGIKSQTGHFRLKNVYFAFNGKAGLTIKGVQKKIDTQPYSYGAPETVLIPKFTSPKKNSRFRATIRYTGLALAITGCATGSWALSEYPKAKKKFNEINTPDSEGVLLYTSSDWNAAKRTRDRDLALLIIGWGVCVIGATGFVVTFTF